MRRLTKGESVKSGATTSVSPPGGRLQYVELTPSLQYQMEHWRKPKNKQKKSSVSPVYIFQK